MRAHCPSGQNAPQQAPFGLYAEQLSGTPFTAPRALNRRTWVYRIRPSVMHKPYRQIADGLAALDALRRVANPAQSAALGSRCRCRTKPPIFSTACITLAGNGDLAMHSGVAIHLYVANRSMESLYFYNADGELLIVPQMGRLLLHTEFGRMRVAPGEIARDAARHQVSRRAAGRRGARLRLRELRRELPAAGAGTHRRQRPGELARLPDSSCRL